MLEESVAMRSFPPGSDEVEQGSADLLGFWTSQFRRELAHRQPPRRHDEGRPIAQDQSISTQAVREQAAGYDRHPFAAMGRAAQHRRVSFAVCTRLWPRHSPAPGRFKAGHRMGGLQGATTLPQTQKSLL